MKSHSPLRPLAHFAVLAAVLLAGMGRAHADRDDLWRIVNEQCVPGEVANRDPAPCAGVDVSAGEDRGYAIFKDRIGARQYLLIPTARIPGIEDPGLRAPDAPDYFAEAWQARAFVEARAGRRLPRDWISLAVNSAVARTQDQLHIHIDCLGPDVHEVLAKYAGQIGSSWSPLPTPLAGHRYDAVAIGGDLASVNPFLLAAEDSPESDPGLTTIVVVGSGSDDRPGFVVLRARADPTSPDPAAGEDLQDHEGCPAPILSGPSAGK